jgi:Zn-finger nucleic acid-binding protein
VEKQNSGMPEKKCPICRKDLEMKEYHGLERWCCPVCSYILTLLKDYDKRVNNGK